MTNFNAWLTLAKLKARNFFTKENGDVNVVSMVILIGVAVLLAIIFKDSITGLLKELLETITGNAKQAVAE